MSWCCWSSACFFASSVLMNVLGWLSPGNSLTNHFTSCITLSQHADFFLPAGVNSLHFIAGRYIAVNFRFSWGGDRPGPVDGWYGWGWEADQAERCYLSFIFGILDFSVCTHEDLENNFVCIWKKGPDSLGGVDAPDVSRQSATLSSATHVCRCCVM
jgi:hypothetical protein